MTERANRMRRAAILQPGYLPWLGFFEQMSKADEFVLLDDVQYTKNDWRNRNRIKTQQGTQWLTVPVSFRFGQRILDVPIDHSSAWARKQIQALHSWYSRAPFFDRYIGELTALLDERHALLVDLDVALIDWLREQLGLSVPMVRSSTLSIPADDRQVRLIEICKAVRCEAFYEGNAGRGYLDTEKFRQHGVEIEFQDYAHPHYHQLWLAEQGFISHLCAIDLLFNHGPDSLAILTGQRLCTLPASTRVRTADDVNAVKSAA